jgi:alpha-L-fucosidase
MNYLKRFLSILIISLLVFSCSKPPPPPVQPVPSERQLAWQEMEYYAFIHFNMNTFSNMEWGFGDEKPEQFNPSELDCRQWAKVCRDAGMKGIIITAKHHDGFCLWPSVYTEHSVKNSNWRNGQGDVIRELSEACKEYGLKMGVYLSPWDRNHADYGQAEYITYFRNQLTELLTNYGEVFEVWFDGANGGTGYYGGANEERRVDKRTYYDWENTYKLIRKLQPNAVIFSDAGPDVRWVGNEHGYAYPTTWSNLKRDSVYGGMPDYHTKYAMGQEDGTHWIPAEADVSIRPGWYYHEYEDHKVKSLATLLDIYYYSIGQNSTLLLNFPVDKRGLIHEKDVIQLQKLSKKLEEDFAINLALGQKVTASKTRGNPFDAKNTLDGNPKTYWAPNDDEFQAELTITFDSLTFFNRFVIQEYIALGQRIKSFSVEAQIADTWKEIAAGTTVGYKRILRLPDTEAQAIKLIIKDAKACPTISNMEVYHAPKLLEPPAILRNKSGKITLESPEQGVAIHYTTDGSVPTINSKKYKSEFTEKGVVTIQAITSDGEQQSEISRTNFDICSEKWNIIGWEPNAAQIIDGDPNTWWACPKDGNNEVIIDLGETLEINGFTYLPMQQRWITGFIKEYSLSVSMDMKNWTLTDSGEFGNILNNPVLKIISFPAIKTRFIRLKAKSTVNDTPAAFAEVAVLTK